VSFPKNIERARCPFHNNKKIIVEQASCLLFHNNKKNFVEQASCLLFHNNKKNFVEQALGPVPLFYLIDG
jgi:hypothetical protein